MFEDLLSFYELVREERELLMDHNAGGLK